MIRGTLAGVANPLLIGLSIEDLEQFLIPYCGKERFELKILNNKRRDMFKFIYNKEKGIVNVTDRQDKELAVAVFAPFLDSDISDPRLNIFIDVDYCVKENADEIKLSLMNELIRLGREAKIENSYIKTRIYHCAFADARDKINYFSTIEGFMHDEGMYVLKKPLKEKHPTTDIYGVNFHYLELNDSQINELMREQHKVFRNGYELEDLIKIRNGEKWLSLSAFQENKLIGNIIMVRKLNEQGQEYAWCDDLFVKKEYRKSSIGQELVNRSINKLIEMGYDYCKLEMWSTNIRAYSVYKKAVFMFDRETQVSIGMEI